MFMIENAKKIYKEAKRRVHIIILLMRDNHQLVVESCICSSLLLSNGNTFTKTCSSYGTYSF